MTKKSWEKTVAENQRAIRELTEPEMKIILPVLGDVREEVAKNFTKFFKNAGYAEKYSMQKHAGMLFQLDKAIRIIHDELGPKTKKQLKTDTLAANKISSSKLIEMMEAGQKKFGGQIATIPVNVVRVLTKTNGLLLHRHERSAQKYAGDVGKRLQRDLAIGLVKNESIDDIAKRLLAGNYQRLKLKGPVAMAEGVAEENFFKNKHEALRLVRTEVVYGYNKTQDEALIEADQHDPGWFEEWDATNDKRTCADCHSLDGQIVRPGEPFDLDGMKIPFPPLHPNDRCGIKPVRKEWKR